MRAFTNPLLKKAELTIGEVMIRLNKLGFKKDEKLRRQYGVYRRGAFLVYVREAGSMREYEYRGQNSEPPPKWVVMKAGKEHQRGFSYDQLFGWLK